MEAAGELANVLEYELEIVLHALEASVHGWLIVRKRSPDVLDLEAEGDQPLLRPVVEVALDTPAHSVSSLDDAHP
jgi:hypothetical protein